MASVVLSNNANSTLDGINLMWNVSGMSALNEITLIYYKNIANSDIQSLDVSPNNSTLNLNLDSGASYSFQLQVTDVSPLTQYSNTLVLTAPYSLTPPVIASFVGSDNKVDLVVNNNGNSLTVQDSVEFICKKTDNSIFWIIKPFQPSGNYSLSASDNILFVNNQSYRIACMFQPSLSNALYNSPSDMSNSMTVTPSNLPNDPTNVALSSVGVDLPALQVTWNKPSDFADWSNNFSIVVRLHNLDNGVDEFANLLTDVQTYTFNNVAYLAPHQAYVQYVNQFGVSSEVPSNTVTPTTKPDAPTLGAIDEGDDQMTLNWIPPSYDGNSEITSYKIFRTSQGNPVALLATVAGDVLTYLDTGMGNGGPARVYYVSAVNAIGESVSSNGQSGIAYGDCAVTNVVINGKQLQMTFSPNGRPIEKIFIVALDSNPSEADQPENFFYEVPTGSISGLSNGTFNLSKTFSTFSDNISFYCVIANNSVSSSFLKSA